MSESPERIWVTPSRYKSDEGNTTGTWGDWKISQGVEYVRADLRTPDPRVLALVEAVKNTLTGYDQWANCASGTPEDSIAAAALFARIIRLRAALAAWEA